TLPWVSIGFRGPGFSTVSPDFAALDMLFDLLFGPTSEVYQDLVERRQIVDQLVPHVSANADPELATIFARVKDPADAAAVRDTLVSALRGALQAPVTARRLEEAKSNARYGFARTLDNSESIAATLARFVRYSREFDTINALYRQYDALTPGDLLAAARTYLRDDSLILTTLAAATLDASFATPPVLAQATAPMALNAPFLRLDGPSALVRFKLSFAAGSAHDPAGKEGLTALTAAMVADAGSADLRTEEVTRALFPIAGSFEAQVDKEVTTFTGIIHRDNLDPFLGIVLPQLTRPGFREEDFARLKENQHNELLQDLRANNEEELGKERLQTLIFRDGPYGHPTLGTESGIAAITLDDVKAWAATAFTQANLTVGGAGNLGDEGWAALTSALAALPMGAPAARPAVRAQAPSGISVEIIEKETRSTAISFGHPIAVGRGHPDFAALWLARAWLGEHRASNGRLFQRLREVRGMNYGNYAYIEAFPRGMYQFFPDTGIPRQQQLFEVWIRPVVPEQAVFAFKLALWEVRRLINDGLSHEAFEATRSYLAKNLFVMTKTQDQQLGYALDSRWYGTPDFVEHLQGELAKLTPDAVNAAVRRHLSGSDLTAVFITKDGAALRAQLLSPEQTTIAYESPKDAETLAEDEIAGRLDLGITPERIVVTPVAEVFA
ncbi:MAG: M16 family metallopeptidase, partial [Dehalococcoidia bacterium]